MNRYRIVEYSPGLFTIQKKLWFIWGHQEGVYVSIESAEKVILKVRELANFKQRIVKEIEWTPNF